MDIDKANTALDAIAARLDLLLTEAPDDWSRLHTQIGQAKLEVRRCQSLLHTAKMRRRRRVS